MINISEASYIEAEVIDFKGHPLINALPKINSPEETAKLLNRLPSVGEGERDLPGYIRRHAMMRILDGFLYPTNAHFQLEQMLSGMIRRGYLGRNIATYEYDKNVSSIATIDFNIVARNAGNDALASSVIGCSGTGKTTAIEAILKGYPNQAIYHPKFQHTQIVWLKLDCPHDGSVKSLCIHFFRTVDEILGTDYEACYVKSRSSAESMLGDIARISALHSIGILVIDEIQHLQAARSGGSSKLLNFFVTLTNVIKVPVLFVGTPNALSLFSPTMRSARRASQFGSLNWNRFERSENRDSSQWNKFITRLWQLQWFEKPTPLSESMMDLFWTYSQGVAHVAVTLFYLCQARAVMVKREIIDLPLVKKVFDEELELIHPMIKALKSGRKDEILKYSDLDLPIDKIRSIVQISSDIEKLKNKNVSTKEKSKFEKLEELLIHAGIGDDVVPIVAAQAIEENPNESVFKLLAHASQMMEKDDPTKKSAAKKSVKLIPNLMKDDLRHFEGMEPEQVYQILKQRNLILNVADYLQ